MELRATLCWGEQALSLTALVDSGADENFLDANLAAQAGVACEQLDTPVRANALDGKLFALVTHRTKSLHLILSGNH